MAFRPKDFPQFTQLDEATMQKLMAEIPRYLHNIAAVLGVNSTSEIFVCQETLYEILTRVEKRRVYFHIYHNGMEMGELNEGALLCFWMLKLSPFKHSRIPNALLNTKIAFTFFVNLLCYVAAKTHKKVNIEKLVRGNLLYTFQYRDLSKEAVMALAESLLY